MVNGHCPVTLPSTILSEPRKGVKDDDKEGRTLHRLLHLQSQVVVYGHCPVNVPSTILSEPRKGVKDDEKQGGTHYRLLHLQPQVAVYMDTVQ